MIRQNIILGNYIYIADLYKAHIDFDNTDIPLKEFVMLKKVNLENDITYDTDVFFIQTDVIKKIIADISENNIGYTNNIVFPINNKGVTTFSSLYNNFDTDLDLYQYVSASSDDFEDGDITNIYNKNGEIAKIECDKVRIYNPSNNPNINAVIYLDSIINNVHLHFFCDLYSNQQIKVDKEFTIDGYNYCEYIEFLIPNIESLFNNREETCLYYKDLYNISTEIDNIYDSIDINKIKVGEDTIIPLHNIIQPYVIKDLEHNGEKLAIKTYLKYNNSIQNNYLTTPINITLYPYYAKNNIIQIYEENINLPANSDIFVTECSFKLSSKMSFNNGIISVINTFNYPNKHLFSTVKEAYKTYYNVSEIDYYRYPYIKISVDEAYDNIFNIPIYCLNVTNYKKSPINTEEYPSEVPTEVVIETNTEEPTKAPVQIPDNYKYILSVNFDPNNKKRELSNIQDDYTQLLSLEELIQTINDTENKYEYFINANDDEEYGEEFNYNPEIKACGYHIKIAADRNFKNVLYTLDVESPFIDDYAFQLNNIFDSWDKAPELLIINTSFVDKLTNTFISGNDVIITKEWYKYLINNIDIHRLESLIEKQTNITNINDMDFSYFNFIDKINCTVVNNTTENNSTNIKVNNKPKVLYKPIFYRTQDLQTIKLKRGLTQNIGINLSDYMTKIETFKLVINGITYVEYARNDIYVIFKVSASDLVSNGTYYIVDQDNEYISTGNYILN